MAITPAAWGRLVVVFVIAVVLQVSVLDQIVILGAHPDVMLVLAAAAGLVAGPQRGAVIAFVVGLFADLVVNLPFGLSSLAFVLVAYGTGLVYVAVASRDIKSVQLILCAAAGGVGTLAYAILGALVDQPGVLSSATASVVLIVVIGAFVLGRPVIAALNWALVGSAGDSLSHAIPTGGSATR